MKKTITRGLFAVILVTIMLLNYNPISADAAGIKTVRAGEKWSDQWSSDIKENQFLFNCTETGFYDVVFEDVNRTAALWIYIECASGKNGTGMTFIESLLEGRINFKIHNSSVYTVQQIPFVKGNTYEISLRYLVIPENYYYYNTIHCPHYYMPEECGEYKDANISVTFKKSAGNINKLSSQSEYYELIDFEKENKVNVLEFTTTKAGDYQLETNLVKSNDEFYCGGFLCDSTTFEEKEQFSVENKNKVFEGLEANKKYYLFMALRGNENRYSKLSINLIGGSKDNDTVSSVSTVCKHSWGEWKTTKEATCEVKGKATRVCSKCEQKETKETEALGHKFDASTVTKKPTCTKTGVESGKCIRCNKTTTNTIKATGHNMTGYTITLEPTCTKEGKKEGTCSTCGEKTVAKISAKGHKFGVATIIKEATETETGLKTQTCSVCNEVKEEVIPLISAESQADVDDEKIDTSVDVQNDKSSLPWVLISIATIVIGAALIIVVISKKKN